MFSEFSEKIESLFLREAEEEFQEGRSLKEGSFYEEGRRDSSEGWKKRSRPEELEVWSGSEGFGGSEGIPGVKGSGK
jgi:hypothetical protein